MYLPKLKSVKMILFIQTLALYKSFTYFTYLLIHSEIIAKKFRQSLVMPALLIPPKSYRPTMQTIPLRALVFRQFLIGVFGGGCKAVGRAVHGGREW